MERKWDQIQATPTFRTLVAEKTKFVVGAMIFFIVYYFALPVSAGYFPGLLRTKVIGSITLGYLFALSQFFMAWTIAYLYVQAANRFDALSEQVKQESHAAQRAVGS